SAIADTAGIVLDETFDDDHNEFSLARYNELERKLRSLQALLPDSRPEMHRIIISMSAIDIHKECLEFSQYTFWKNVDTLEKKYILSAMEKAKNDAQTLARTQEAIRNDITSTKRRHASCPIESIITVGSVYDNDDDDGDDDVLPCTPVPSSSCTIITPKAPRVLKPKSKRASSLMSTPLAYSCPASPTTATHASVRMPFEGDLVSRFHSQPICKRRLDLLQDQDKDWSEDSEEPGKRCSYKERFSLKF
ncbi:hypothetical protein ADUPG1_001642, partial [Aduncisulcus paluster]